MDGDDRVMGPKRRVWEKRILQSEVWMSARELPPLLRMEPPQDARIAPTSWPKPNWDQMGILLNPTAWHFQIKLSSALVRRFYMMWDAAFSIFPWNELNMVDGPSRSNQHFNGAISIYLKSWLVLFVSLFLFSSVQRKKHTWTWNWMKWMNFLFRKDLNF